MQYRSPAVVLLSLVLEFAIPHSTWSDSTKGSQLAQQWCANCHVVRGNPTGAIPQGPPSFQTIARSNMTVDQLRAFLSHPHGAMPDLSLTRAEIDDLIGYIATLR